MSKETGLKIFLAFAAVYIIWGSTYVMVLIALRSIPPFVLSSFRFLFSGTILYLWCRVKGEKRPEPLSLRRNIISGILTLFGGTVSIAWAEQYLPSSLAAIIVTSVPFWFILLDRRQWSFYASNKIIFLGLLLGMAGVFILFAFNNTATASISSGPDYIISIIVIVAGGLVFTIGSLYSKYNPAHDSVMMNGSIQLIGVGVFTFIVAIVSGEWQEYHFSNTGTTEWLAIAYLITFGSIITYISYLWLLTVRPAAQVTTYVYVNPIVAVLLGAIMENEQITFMQVVALAIILSGVLIVNMVKNKGSYQKLTDILSQAKNKN